MIVENRRENLAWVAGFFDGEGYAGHTPCGRHFQSTVAIRQKHVAPLLKVQQIIGFGNVRGPYYKHRDTKTFEFYEYAIGKFEHIQAFGALVWTWLGPAKRSQFRKIMSVKGRQPALMKVVGMTCSRCDRPVKCKGLCEQHYGADRYWVHGGREKRTEIWKKDRR